MISKPKSLWSRLVRDRFLYLLIAPGVIYFIIFKIIPLGGLIISFEDYSPYRGFLHSQWIGLSNYIRFFSNKDFLLLLRNTLVISFLNLIFYFPIPIILSLLLNELRNQRFKRILQSIVYLPHFLSWVIVVGICYILFSQSNGIINQIIMAFGHNKIDFLQNPHIFWGMLVGQNIWKESGYGTIIFLAAISGIDPQQYEAAIIDGASRIKQMWYVTLPGIRGTIITLLILRIGSIMNVGFEQVFLMMNGAVSEVADVFETYVYRVGVQNGQFSYTTAVGFFKSIVGLVLILFSNYIARRFGEEGVY
ncbi:MAG TPA: polysaccharide ABC transporter ATP-binding protein [Clostridiaceae bacterium]|nr:polysaccharide ABC transporter ATP-binding protein [Clostridiaceae bacterium]